MAQLQMVGAQLDHPPHIVEAAQIHQLFDILCCKWVKMNKKKSVVELRKIANLKFVIWFFETKNKMAIVFSGIVVLSIEIGKFGNFWRDNEKIKFPLNFSKN